MHTCSSHATYSVLGFLLLLYRSCFVHGVPLLSSITFYACWIHLLAVSSFLHCAHYLPACLPSITTLLHAALHLYCHFVSTTHSSFLLHTGTRYTCSVPWDVPMHSTYHHFVPTTTTSFLPFCFWFFSGSPPPHTTYTITAPPHYLPVPHHFPVLPPPPAMPVGLFYACAACSFHFKWFVVSHTPPPPPPVSHPHTPTTHLPAHTTAHHT